MAIDTDLLKNRLHELHEKYVKSREALAILENVNKGHLTYIGPHNELRSALDHIMRMIYSYLKSDEPAFNEEYDSALSHLLRAAYDSYELICMDQMDYISKSALAEFEPSDIMKGFPNYYKEIKPDLLGIKLYTASIREKKKHFQNTNEHEGVFNYYIDAVERILKHVQEIDKHIPVINEFREERINKENSIREREEAAEKREQAAIQRERKINRKNWIVNVSCGCITLVSIIITVYSVFFANSISSSPVGSLDSISSLPVIKNDSVDEAISDNITATPVDTIPFS